MAIVMARDMPDPHIMVADGRTWVYATQNGSTNIQVAVSDDLATWQHLGDAMPDLAAWLEPGHTWAAKVIFHDNRYMAYYSARYRATGQQAIGVARAVQPGGRFYPVPWPLIVGFIDADVISTDEGLVILYASGCDGVAPGIRMQRLTPDGLSLFGDAVTLLGCDQDDEGNVIEAPTLCRRPDGYTLIYSVNAFESDRYRVCFATSLDLWGPYTKQGTLLASNADMDGPGHQDVFTAPDGQEYIAYHAWHKGRIGYSQGHYRALAVSRLTWDGLRPVVAE